MNMKRVLSLISLTLAALLMLTGCSSGGKESYSVKIAAAVPYVLEGAQDKLQAALNEGLPSLTADGQKMLIQTVNTGDTKADPMSAMAGMSKVTTMFLGKEIEILICDADNAQRHGEGGETYMTLEKLFTPDEQADMGIEALSVLKTDGAPSAACGISLADCEGIRNIFKMSDLGLYVIDTPETEANLENIRTAVRYILSME